MKKTLFSLIALFACLFLAVSCTSTVLKGFDAENSLYADESNWFLFEDELSKAADIFVVAPTVDKGLEGNMNANMYDETFRTRIESGMNSQLELYEDLCNIYCPYYSQASFPVYLSLPVQDRAQYLDIAYEGIREAFLYYLSSCDSSRPLILFGYSQGADMVVRLLKEFFGDDALMDRLVATYAIGWYLTEEEVSQFPQLRMAAGESDTGVIISYEAESEGVSGSAIVPEGVTALSINPLSWKTDHSVADRSLNLGCCVFSKQKELTSEVPEFSGAYISERGTLIVTDVNPSDYSNSYFPDGVLHLNDISFFFRNLEENMKVRLSSYSAVV